MDQNTTMIVLHITLIVLQALVAIVQYILGNQLKSLRNEVREMLGKPV